MITMHFAASLCLGVCLFLLGSAAGAQPALEVDLLHAVPSTITVSSTVANTTDRPEHLVDGRLGTAWGSHTGDLAGAYLTVTVPAAARVRAIRLTVGFAHQDRKGDLFLMNHRIRKVAVYREEELVGAFDLDPERRELQDLPIDRPGGTYWIEIRETVPGTKKTWREVCISELQVMGTPPPGTQARRRTPTFVTEPDTKPDHFDKPAIGHVEGPFSSVRGFCSQWNRAFGERFKDPGRIYTPAPPYCDVDKVDFKGAMPLPLKDTPPRPLRAARLIQVDSEKEDYIWAGLQTDRGWYLVRLLYRDDHENPHCAGNSELILDRASTSRYGAAARLTLQYRLRSVLNLDGGGESVQVTHRQAVCAVPPEGEPSCQTEDR